MDEIIFTKLFTRTKMNIINKNHNINVVDKIDNEISHMHEVSQMM
jgi:hypothetical protein